MVAFYRGGTKAQAHSLRYQITLSFKINLVKNWFQNKKEHRAFMEAKEKFKQ